MNKNIYAMMLGAFLGVLTPHISMAAMSEDEALKLGTQAYIYGYPLVTMDLTRKVMTNVEVPEKTRAPMGQFLNAREYPDASFKDVTTPNADTLYSFAWLSLSKEPYILHLPDEKDRYYLMPMLSGWTDIFEVPGTRTTGTKAQDYAIVGPMWKGDLPKGVKEIKAPTNMVWIIGRTYCDGTPEDYVKVHAIQDQYKVTPLSAYGKPYTPPKGTVDPSIDMKTPVRDQVNAMAAASFFKKLAQLMQDNPPAKADAPMVEKLKKLGIVPGVAFDISKLDANAVKGLNQSVKAGLEKIKEQEKVGGIDKNGWLFSLKTGVYGTDYLQRAFITAVGLGANLPEDAVYPMAHVDSKGKRLNGANKYVIHFAKEKMPPVKGFWSLTMYDEQMFFVQNPLNKYTVSPRNHLTFNQDGSLDLYVQHDSPGKEKENNWLPAPTGNFNLMFRFYWPEEPIIKGKWNPPGVEMVK